MAAIGAYVRHPKLETFLRVSLAVLYLVHGSIWIEASLLGQRRILKELSSQGRAEYTLSSLICAV